MVYSIALYGFFPNTPSLRPAYGVESEQEGMFSEPLLPTPPPQGRFD